MMIRWIAAIALWAGLSSAAVAQVPTSYSLIDSSANHFQVGAFQNSISSKIFPGSVSVDASGNPMAGVAGATNPQSQALYVQGVTNGVPLYVTFPTAQHVICDSGCGGGGGGGGLSVPFAGPIGANGTPGGFKDATGNLQPLLGDITNGEWVLIKNASIAVTGTFFQATQPISAASLPLPTGASTAALQPTNAAAGSSTPGQTGTLVMGSVVSSTSYIAGQSNPLTLDPAGLLRVNVVSGGSANASVGGTGSSVPASATYGGMNVAGNLVGFTGTANGLKVDGSAVTQPVAGTLTAVQPTGTNLHMVCDSGCAGNGGTSSTIGAAYPSVATAIGMSQSGNMVAFTGTSGSLNVNITGGAGAGGTSSNFGSAFPTGGTAIGLTNGTNMVAWSASSNYGTSPGAIAVPAVNASITNSVTVAQPTAASLNATVIGTGTFAVQAAQSGAWNITNISGTISLPTGAATAALQPTNAAQGSTTSGQTGPLMQAAVLSSSPTYLTTQTSPLTMTTAGALRVDGSGVTQPVSGTVAISNSSIAVTQATASSLNATVVGTGTFAVQAAQSGAWNITNITGTISLPTGAATSALQTTINNSLSVNTLTIAHTCLVSGYSVASCMGQIDDDVKGPLPLLVNGTATGTSGLTPGTAQTGTIVAMNTDLTSIGGTAIGAMANYGTSPGAVKVQGVNAFVTNTVTISGSVSISGGSVSAALNTTPTLANGNGVVPTQGGTVLSATNGGYTNLLQGNAVLSTSNGIFVAPTTSFAVQATLQASATTAIGKVDPNTIGNWGLAASTQNGTTPTNAALMMGQFNTTPTTITSGNVSPFQLDNAGNLLVNIKVGGGAGGTSSSFGSAFPSTGTAIGLTNGTNMVAWSATTNYGTAPSAIAVPAVNASVTNTVTVALNATPSLANGNGVVPTQGGSVLSATNGMFDNILQGNAVLSATNGLFSNILQGNVVLSITNPLFASVTDGTTKAKVEPVSTPAATTDAALAVAPLPSELHIGETGSNQIKVDVAQTVTASAYSAGNAIGGLMTVAGAARVSGTSGNSGTGGILTGLMLDSKSVQSTQVDIFIFDANPTGSTCTDKTAFVLATADANKVVGVLTIPGTAANGAGWFSGGTGSLGIPTYYPITYSLASATSIYGCAVARGAFTPASTSDVSFKWNMLRD